MCFDIQPIPDDCMRVWAWMGRVSAATIATAAAYLEKAIAELRHAHAFVHLLQIARCPGWCVCRISFTHLNFRLWQCQHTGIWHVRTPLRAYFRWQNFSSLAHFHFANKWVLRSRVSTRYSRPEDKLPSQPISSDCRWTNKLPSMYNQNLCLKRWDWIWRAGER